MWPHRGYQIPTSSPSEDADPPGPVVSSAWLNPVRLSVRRPDLMNQDPARLFGLGYSKPARPCGNDHRNRQNQGGNTTTASYADLCRADSRLALATEHA